MNFLEERIMQDGLVKPGNVLKVDSFLNHQMDIALMEEIGREFKRRFGNEKVTKVLTIESSGIGIAVFVAKEFGVPMVFAKKSKSINIDGVMYVAEVESFTHKNKNQVIVSKKFLSSDDHVLI
ncbi:MAG: xanthine phosphoribosyltransferase, partial [Clostridia bacterium]|nr:xanthine phosphoribosyltransferase [Clostridia bacterium]